MRLVVGALVALASLSGCITLTAEQLKQVQEQNDSMMQMIAQQQVTNAAIQIAIFVMMDQPVPLPPMCPVTP